GKVVRSRIGPAPLKAGMAQEFSERAVLVAKIGLCEVRSKRSAPIHSLDRVTGNARLVSIFQRLLSGEQSPPALNLSRYCQFRVTLVFRLYIRAADRKVLENVTDLLF